MTRRIQIAVGLIAAALVSGGRGSDDSATVRVRPTLAPDERGVVTALRARVSEATLLALERENGCVEPAEGEPIGQGVWPDWKTATIAGGDVPPARVVSDPYPTLHSVVVDAGHDKVFMSDPNRHA